MIALCVCVCVNYRLRCFQVWCSHVGIDFKAMNRIIHIKWGKKRALTSTNQFMI